MTIRTTAAVASLLLGTAVLTTASAEALTRRECTDKYIAAQTAGSAKGVKLSDFRNAECGTAATSSDHRRAHVRNKRLNQLEGETRCADGRGGRCQ